MARISLGEGLLAAGSGLLKGILARRESDKADRRYRDQRADQEMDLEYQRKRQSLQDALEQQKLEVERRHWDILDRNYQNQETPQQKMEREGLRANTRKYVADTSAANSRLRASVDRENSIRSDRRLTAAERSQALRDNASQLGMEMRSLRDARGKLVIAKQFASPDDLPDIINTLAETDSLMSGYGKQMPSLYKGALDALSPGDGDGPDVEGATEDATETPATQDQMAPDQFSMPGAPTLGQALQPATPQAQPSLGQAVAQPDTAGIPPEVMVGIMKAATRLPPNRSADYVRAQIAKYRAQTGAR